MEEIVKFTSYNEYKKSLDSELQKTAEGFVRIGYLLKLAMDTDILKESKYKNVNEFAQKEYGIDKSQVSRFIRINNRFSENGYSERLKEEYQGYGYAKLSIMLQLPDEIIEELSPEYSKSEIQTIKEELDEEKKISDLEVLMEEKDKRQQDMDKTIYQFMYQLGKEQPELYVELWKAADRTSDDVTNTSTAKEIAEIMAPDGQASYNVRIPGTGRLALYLKGLNVDPVILNMRHPEEKEFCTWQEMAMAVYAIAPNVADARRSWEEMYEEKFPVDEKEKVAPVQQEKKEQRKQSKVTKAKTEPPKPKKNEWKDPEIVEKEKEIKLHDVNPDIPEPDPVEEKQETEDVQPETQEEQIPGQAVVEDYPEIMPETQQEDIHVQAVDITQVKADVEMYKSKLNGFINIQSYRAALECAERLVESLKIILGEK